MDRWEWEWGYRNKGGAAITSPSFSSSLLDAIDRSIDQRGDSARPPPAPTNYQHRLAAHRHQLPPASCLYYDARAAGTDLVPLQPKQRRGAARLSSARSLSESSESSSAGGFSSSEAESRRRKPPLTERSTRLLNREREPPPALNPEAAPRKQQPKLQSHRHKDAPGTIKGRIRASRSPVSPGGRLAAFLNTLFTNANTRTKSKTACTSTKESAQPTPLPLPVNPPRLFIPVPASDAATGCVQDNNSFCSSASRSCLSKTPSTHAKRSVRFCPVNVVVDDVLSRRFFPPAPVHARVATVAPPKHPLVLDGDVEFYDDEDDDGTASCSSSDLFELDNLTGVDTGSRYADELPLYETTHLRSNRAIAHGLIV